VIETENDTPIPTKTLYSRNEMDYHKYSKYDSDLDREKNKIRDILRTTQKERLKTRRWARENPIEVKKNQLTFIKEAKERQDRKRSSFKKSASKYKELYSLWN